MKNVKVLILAAGLGKRMHSELPKALHRVCGHPMLSHVLDAATSVSETFVCVVGHGRQQVMDAFRDRMQFVVQEEQRGTGHAVRMAESLFGDGDVLVLFADTPLITAETLQKLVVRHQSEGNAATLITAESEDPGAFGRIVRGDDGKFLRIVEFKNATDEEKRIKEINSGIAVFDAALLREKIALLSDDNAQGEYLLTDVFEMLVQSGKKVGVVLAGDPTEIAGVNDRYMLSEVECILLNRVKKERMLSGVTIHMPDTVYIEKSVRLEPGVVIEQGCHLSGDVTVESGAVIRQGSRLSGRTHVAADAVIGPQTDLRDVRVGRASSLDRTVAVESEIGAECKIGPFAYIRPNCRIFDRVKIGDFVELKNSVIGSGTKIPHLSYIGDGEIGERTNIGCGTIFVNYDGEHKHRTVVGSDAFIGCNANLIAPVLVGDRTFVAAGSTITSEVKNGEFAISRTPQINKRNRRDPKKE